MKARFLAAAAAILLAVPHSSALGASVTQVVTTMNSVTGAMDFQITYDTAPDFFTTDSAGRQADSFQFYIGTLDRKLSSPPANSIIRGEEIHYGGGIPIRNLSPSDPSPQSGGWGTTRGTVPFVLNNTTLEFTIPIAILNEPTGLFSYLFDAVQFGSHDQPFFAYISDGPAIAGPVAVPLPSALPLFASGLAGLGWLSRRRRKQPACS